MNKRITLVLVLVALANAFFLKAVVEGRHATAETLYTRSDAVSYCVRGVINGNIRWTRVHSCLQVALRNAWRARMIVETGKKEVVLKESFQEINESRRSLEAWETKPAPETVRN